MVDFSSVNLRILSPDGRTVLAELQTLDRTNVRTVRNIGTAQTAALGQVQRQAAMSARQIAGNVALIASTGEATVGSLKGIVSQGANIAFMFGTGGAIAGAIGVTALAIVNLFNRTRKEIEETAKKATEELGRLTRAGDIGQVGGRFGVATQLFSGDRFAVRGQDESERSAEARRLGIRGVRARIAEQQALFDAATGGGAVDQARRQNARNRMREWQAELEKLTSRYERLIGLVKELEDQAGFSATRTLEELRAKSSTSMAETLEKLSDKNLLPDFSAIGFTTREFGPEFNEQMLAGIQDALKRGPPALTTALDEQELADLLGITEWAVMAEGIGDQLGMTLGEGIANGVRAAIETGNIGTAFEAMTGTILQGIGAMAIEVGTRALIFAKLFASLQAWMIANPIAAIPIAVGLIAFGAALQSIGAGMGGGGGIGGGGGGGGFGGGGFGGGGGTIIDRGLVNPLNGVVTAPGTIQPRPAQNFNFNVIGEHDPVAQRAIVRLVRSGLGREGTEL